MNTTTERVDTLVVGAGQAGLATAYHLARRGREVLIIEADTRVGEQWRRRWDSMRLFTPARFDGLPGMPYPGDPWALPTGAEFGDFLERYAAQLDVPLLTGTRARRLSRTGDQLKVDTDHGTVIADNVVAACGYDALPQLPTYAVTIAPHILQLHSVDYRNPGQLPRGDVLVVGAGNSGADIAVELAHGGHRVLLSGRHPGQLPFQMGSPASRPLARVIFWAFRHVLTVRTPLGRRVRPQVLAHSGPLIRVRSIDIDAAGVERIPRVVGVLDGRPQLENGHLADVAAVVWCTGYRPNDSWIELPVFADDGTLQQRRGVTPEPGLYVIGRLFQYSLSSSMIQGVGRDADWVAAHISARKPTTWGRPASANTSTMAG
jgi:putative flavoprotein involved in K+ transport